MAGGEQVYATLLLSDSYLPGALVLAHSLRDARTTRKLAVLVTLDTVSADAITQLKTLYDYVLPVPRIRNDQPANLYLMDRGDLHSAFTKINLWKQVQFSKIVYVDADVVAYRAPDELFSIPHAFAAAPDIGWPDLFNTGVMVLTPDMGDYYAMLAMAERGISFDGADQGLLNMHFKNSHHRLSFTYNVTPSAHYQYTPAYRHLQSSINMVHFIGANKPWFAGRNAPHGTSPFDEMVGRWWAVYDRHYRVQEKETPQQGAPSGPGSVQYFTKGEPRPETAPVVSTTDEPLHGHPCGHQQDLGHQRVDQGGADPHGHVAQEISTHRLDFACPSGDSAGSVPETQSEAPSEQRRSELLTVQAPPHEPEPSPVFMASWDAQRHPPPADSKPEAVNFPSIHYTMSHDTAPFVPPERYPSPPRNMWYEVPEEPPAPPAQPPKPVFPWEGHQPRPSRIFPIGDPEPYPSGAYPGPQGEPQWAGEPGAASAEQSVTGPTPAGAGSVPSTPPRPSMKAHIPRSEEPWTSFQLNNAWDEIPEIGRYVEHFQKHRRIKSQDASAEISSPLGVASPRPSRKSRGFKLTDFPSEAERPSLPVTPAPIARPSFWGDDDSEAHESESKESLPVAQGVPAQSEWDPEVQLQKLARQQYEHLLRKFSGDNQAEEGNGAGRVLPNRSLPYGSEDIKSPTYIAHRMPTTISRPTAVKPEASTMTGGAAPETETTQPGLSTVRPEATKAGTGSPAAEDDSNSPLLESPMPRVKNEEGCE